MRSRLRAVSWALTTPLLADDYLKLINPLWSSRELRGRIVEVRPETRDSVTLAIKPGWGFRFDHQPGQYIGIGVLVDGRWRWRSYSLTSPASAGQRSLTITVKAMPEGFLSGHLVNGVRPGTVVRLAAPRGGFVMGNPAPEKVLFLTAGSGITPVMSMLRTMVRRNQIHDVEHLHSVPERADVMFAAELAAIGDRHRSYRLSVRETNRDGRLNLGRLDDVVPDWRLRQTWACGPAEMLDDAERLWAAAGVADRLHLERFTAPRTAAVDGGGVVTFGRSGRSTTADAATSLMEAGEQAGVVMPFGCRMGICHTCVVSLVEGRVRDLRTGAEHEPGSLVQTCVTAPAGDCRLDA